MPNEVKELAEAFNSICSVVGEYIVGREHVLQRFLEALLIGGHVLVEGVPGTAKTYVAKAFAVTLGLDFKRVQLTPDLLPSDILGTLVYNQKTMEFEFRRGPVFTNILLADELNRTPPRTQAALLEAMQEGQVTVAGRTYRLPEPFMIIATENPVETEGVYPLPEAELDRFTFRVVTPYPSAGEEVEVLRKKALHGEELDVEQVLRREDVFRFREIVKNVKVSDAVMKYIVDLVRATRENPSLVLGASTRAAVHLFYASRAHAAVGEGRNYVIPDDVRDVFPDVINHRLVLRPEVLVSSYSKEPLWTYKALIGIVREILESIPVPR